MIAAGWRDGVSEVCLTICSKVMAASRVGLAQICGLEDVALAHLQRVNHGSERQARNYMESRFGLWTQRNAFTWTYRSSPLRNFVSTGLIPSHAIRWPKKPWTTVPRSNPMCVPGLPKR